jgi:aromatic ring hydroxylase
MSIRTPQQYVESLKDGRVVYCLGERVKDVTQHPFLRVCIDWMAMDYVLQQDPRYQSLVTEHEALGSKFQWRVSSWPISTPWRRCQERRL